jgi:hypothetical protein
MRSTGRKRGRKTLFLERISFECDFCGRTSKKPPPDAPEWFDEIWPEERRVLDYSLQVNHISKDISDNDPANLEWLCADCHKWKDSQTAKGEVDRSEYGYLEI